MGIKNSKMKILLISLVLTTVFPVAAVWAHHGTHIADKPTEANVISAINEHYVSDVKPIFEKKCADCHGSVTVYPGYYKIPLVKQLMDSDIVEGHEHLDFSKGFPFAGHAS